VLRAIPRLPVLSALALLWVGALGGPAAAGPAEECIQEVLALHGYDPGSIDGVMGPRTRAMAESFAHDWRLEVPRLSAATAPEWCEILRLAQRGAGQPLDPAMVEMGAPEGEMHCAEAPPDGYAREITGIVDGDPVTLRVSARFGGAVDSLRWRGREFLNIYDHGRQISYAWHLDDHGECLNPTEPGSAADGFAQSSTTEVLAICSDGPNRLSTRVLPAYWLGPGERGFCDNGTVEAVNTALVSDTLFEKEIEIGYAGLDNVIAFDAHITLPGDRRSLRTEMPTAYLGPEFTARYSFDPLSGELLERDTQDIVEPWSFRHGSNLPTVLATEDGAYALGAYTPHPGAHYELLYYDVPNPFDATNKWNIRVSEVPAPAGTYRYRSYVILGTLEDVRRSMLALYELEPTDLRPDEGYVDRADCSWIEGWAWDPDAPGEAMVVDVFRSTEGGERGLLFSVEAGAYRADLATALQDSGQHAFSIATRGLLPEGGRHELFLEVRSSVVGLPSAPLVPSRVLLDCNG
jgi:hypothetical protein